VEEHIRAYARLRLEDAREELETAHQNIALGTYGQRSVGPTMLYFTWLRQLSLVNRCNGLNTLAWNRRSLTFWSSQDTSSQSSVGFISEHGANAKKQIMRTSRS